MTIGDLFDSDIIIKGTIIIKKDDVLIYAGEAESLYFNEIYEEYSPRKLIKIYSEREVGLILLIE